MSRVWFITGAGSGIGAAVAQAVIAAGERVVATGRDAAKVREALRDVAGPHLLVLPLDVTSEAQAAEAVAAAVRAFGRIDMLVNNAGYSLLGNFEEMATGEIERLFATNFWGVVHVTRAVLPVMRRQRAGHVLNISSVGGAVGFAHCSAYSASKFAVEGLSLSIAEEVAPFGIKVTIVEPGFFRTQLLAPRNARWASGEIEDYARDTRAEAKWSPFDGTQQGDPRKLGEALLGIVALAQPPRIFAAGSDALAVITPAVENRLRQLREFAALSASTDGVG